MPSGRLPRMWWKAGLALLAPMLVVSQAHAQGSQKTTFAGIERAGSDEETFVANQLGLIHTKITSRGFIFNSTSEFWRVVRGNYRHPVEYSTFFRSVNRSDLADSYETRYTLATVMTWSGLGMFFGGVGIGAWGIYEHREKIALTGLGIAIAGVIVNRIGGGVTDPCISETEASVLVDRYNEALLNHLGMSKPRASAPSNWWSVVPFADAKHLGLLAAHRF